MADAPKRRKDEEEPGFGLRTPTRKVGDTASRKRLESDPPAKSDTGRAQRPAKSGTGRVERPAKSDTGRAERPAKGDTGRAERPAKGDTGRAERPAKSDTGRAERPAKGGTGRAERPAKATEAPAGGSKVPLLLGLVLVLAAGGGAAAVFLGGSPAPPPAVPVAAAPSPSAAPSSKPVQIPLQARPSPRELTPVAAASPIEPLPAPAAAQPADPGAVASALEELARRSAHHAEVARVLEEFADLFELNLLANHPGFVDFEERQRREEELLARLRGLGPLAVEALQDMVLGLQNRAHQILVAKALAGMDGPEALAAVESILGQTRDVALQTTLARFLPEGPATLEALNRAYGREQDPNLRTMLLREYARRGSEGDGGELFRQAALSDQDVHVRAEAVTILGRRGNAADAELMERIIREEQNLQIRQRAIVAYAETGGTRALTFLEDLARSPESSVQVRASAVLAIGRVGGDGALRSLDTIGQTDPDPEIRTRATRLAASLRARAAAAQNPEAPDPVDDEPMRLGPGAEPLRRQ